MSRSGTIGGSRLVFASGFDENLAIPGVRLTRG
jgi:hypothetical protein